MKEDLDLLRMVLIRRGIPVRQACRLAGELAAHLEDAEDELIRAGISPHEAAAQARERLGELGPLADDICGTLARRTLWGRHPVVSFVLLPLLSFALIPLVPIATGKPLNMLLDFLRDGAGYDLQTVLACCRNGFLAYQYLLAALCAACFVGIATRSACSMKWAAVAAGILALFGGLLVSVLTVGPPVAAGAHLSGTITLGLGVGDGFSPERLVRCCLPLATFAALAGQNVWHGYLRPSTLRG